MHRSEIFSALICINNDVLSCLISMLSVRNGKFHVERRGRDDGEACRVAQANLAGGGREQEEGVRTCGGIRESVGGALAGGEGEFSYGGGGLSQRARGRGWVLEGVEAMADLGDSWYPPRFAIHKFAIREFVNLGKSSNRQFGKS